MQGQRVDAAARTLVEGRAMHDLIVVGARRAGAATAMLLAGDR